MEYPGVSGLFNQNTTNFQGMGRQVVASSAPNALFGFKRQDDSIYACPATGCAVGSNNYNTGGIAGWLMGGTRLYATGCVGAALPCVNF
jgi:hypothetical protein